MTIVDAQVHLWEGFDVGTEPHQGRPSFAADELLSMMNEAGVGRAVIVPPPWDPQGNRVAIDAAHAEPYRFGVMGHIDVRQEVSGKLIARWMDDPSMLGLRVAFRREPYATRLINGTTDWLWRAVSDAGIPVMAYTPGALELIGLLADKYPDLRLIVDHMGIHPQSRGDHRQSQLDAAVRLAQHRNLAVKVSALPFYSDIGYPFRDTHEMAYRLVEAFGPRRCFWGTDLTRLNCSYREAVEMFTRHMEGLSSEALNMVMGEGILEWLNWK